MIVGILQTGHANIKSLSNTIERMGHEVTNVSTPQQMELVDKLILPGVGAFPAVISELVNENLASAIVSFAASKPLMGICLGMQLMLESSTENGFSQGLGLIKGSVEILPKSLGPIPHVGWNEIFSERKTCLMTDVPSYSNVYFVHSYHCNIFEDIEVIYTDFYGQKIIAGFQKGNIFGVQFHPEKSQKVGNLVLQNFMDYKHA
jgi:imidazole glycerol-phosphate synthase subunit HisH